MPSTPNRSSKTLQEIARVFNKLASELTAELNHAVKEIESLKRDIQRLKSTSNRNPRTPSSNTNRRNTSNRSSRPKKNAMAARETQGARQETHRDSTKPNQESSFVFPREPFNPPAPPEPTTPGNN